MDIGYVCGLVIHKAETSEEDEEEEQEEKFTITF